MARYNKLLNTMRSTLEGLRRAICGEVVMSQELDKMFKAILINGVPEVTMISSLMIPLFFFFLQRFMIFSPPFFFDQSLIDLGKSSISFTKTSSKLGR